MLTSVILESREHIKRSPAESNPQGERMSEFNARKTHCKYGHPFSGDNLYIQPKGHRQCKACIRRNVRDIYDRNPRKKLEKNKEWLKKNHDKVLKQTRERRLRTPQANKARSAVSNAILAGRLEKQPCSECGEPTVDFHHSEGYDQDKWFVGVWLCRPHHAEVHKKVRRLAYETN